MSQVIINVLLRMTMLATGALIGFLTTWVFASFGTQAIIFLINAKSDRALCKLIFMTGASLLLLAHFWCILKTRRDHQPTGMCFSIGLSIGSIYVMKIVLFGWDNAYHPKF